MTQDARMVEESIDQDDTNWQNIPTSNADALSTPPHCLLISNSDGNNNNGNHRAGRFTNLPFHPFNHFLNDLVQQTLHFTDDQTCSEGFEEYEEEYVAEGVLGLKSLHHYTAVTSGKLERKKKATERLS